MQKIVIHYEHEIYLKTYLQGNSQLCTYLKVSASLYALVR